MDFMKFTIIAEKDTHSGSQELEMLINVRHIISIKPIKIVIEQNIINGYWIRTTNSKKYRATKIPQVIADAFTDSKSAPKEIVNVEETRSEEVFQ